MITLAPSLTPAPEPTDDENELYLIHAGWERINKPGGVVVYSDPYLIRALPLADAVRVQEDRDIVSHMPTYSDCNYSIPESD